MIKILKTFLGLGVLLLLFGCQSTPEDEAGSGAETSGAETSGAALGAGLDGGSSANIIYFEYNSSAIDSDSAAKVEAHAKHLEDNPGIQVRLEGHCDERGTREYNLALGEQRAKAVARMVKLLGVDKSRIETVSFGEEKPADESHDESAWQQNRRVVIVY